MERNETYSNKDMTGWDLSDRTDMSGIYIEGLCLSQETPDAQVLPKDLTGTTFVACNLSNVVVPDGNILIDCHTTRFEAQNDLMDWKIDEENNPIEPVDIKTFERLGISTDPADIPEVPADIPIVLEVLQTKAEEKEQAIDDFIETLDQPVEGGN
jgi:hypothetical protein